MKEQMQDESQDETQGEMPVEPQAEAPIEAVAETALEPSAEGVEPASDDQPPGETPPEVEPPSVVERVLLFAAGFLGWYLLTAVVYNGMIKGEEMIIICGGVLFPVNVILLILLLRRRSFIGWGLLSALGVNMIVSLIMGLSTNAFCFVPFFAGME